MTANGKIQITIHSNNGDSDFCPTSESNFLHSRVVLADAILRTIDLSTLSLVELRIVVPTTDADELVVGMVKGDTEIVIGKISPIVEPN